MRTEGKKLWATVSALTMLMSNKFSILDYSNSTMATVNIVAILRLRRPELLSRRLINTHDCRFKFPTV